MAKPLNRPVKLPKGPPPADKIATPKPLGKKGSMKPLVMGKKV